MKKEKSASKTEYITGTGQRLWNIHSYEVCAGRPCVIHNPSSHSMRDFPTHWRSDRGLMERICSEHQVGHPDPDSPFESGSYQWVHGCCGCCVGSYGDNK